MLDACARQFGSLAPGQGSQYRTSVLGDRVCLHLMPCTCACTRQGTSQVDASPAASNRARLQIWALPALTLSTRSANLLGHGESLSPKRGRRQGGDKLLAG